MKGVVFNLVEQIVSRDHGEDTWDALLDAAALDGVYTSLGSYPDEDLFKLVSAASVALDLTPDEVLRYLGREAFPFFAGGHPELVDRHSSVRALVLTLNQVIHPQVRKLYPGADVPEFDFDTSSADVLVMDYRSKRRMCGFAEGLIHGSADWFGERVELRQPTCMNRGGEKCSIEIRATR